MNLRILGLAGVGAFAMIMSPAAMASSYGPGCTKQPNSAWMPMDAAAATVTKAGYAIAKSKVSGNCYEFYVRKNGAKTELFLDPTDGRIVHNKNGV